MKLVNYLRKLAETQLDESHNYLNYDPDYAQRCYDRYLMLQGTIDIIEPPVISKLIPTCTAELYEDYGTLESLILNGEVYVYNYSHPEYDFTINEKTFVGLFSVEIEQLDYYSAYIFESKSEARNAAVELIYQAEELLIG